MHVQFSYYYTFMHYKHKLYFSYYRCIISDYYVKLFNNLFSYVYAFASKIHLKKIEVRKSVVFRKTYCLVSDVIPYTHKYVVRVKCCNLPRNFGN